MSIFSGFSDVNARNSIFPGEFFSQVLNEINDLDELKITIYIFWFLSRKEKDSQWIFWQDIISDEKFLNGFSKDRVQALSMVKKGVLNALQRKTILSNKSEGLEFEAGVFVPNSPFGKATMKRVASKNMDPLRGTGSNILRERDRPNIFILYEQHIGPLTPMISETLQEAEKEYPADWLTDAMQAAVKNNVRRWTYIEAILKRWKQEGRNEKERRDHQEDRRKYVDGKYGNIIKH